nr:hypothetical protein [Tanacetum cinerariifolium]
MARIVNGASGLSFLTVVCLIRQRFISSDLSCSIAVWYTILAVCQDWKTEQGSKKNAKGNVDAGNRGAQNKVGNINVGQGKPIKCYNCNGIYHIVRNCNQPKRPQNSDYFKEKMLMMQAQENRVDLDKEQLLFLAGGQTNTFDDDVDEGPANQCDAFNYDVDEAPTAQTMCMANLSSVAPVYDEACLSYDSDTLSEVPNHDNFLDDVNESLKEHETQNDVQPNDIIDSDTEYTSNSNRISYEQYVQHNEA